MPALLDTVVDPEIHALFRKEAELLVLLRESLDKGQGDERRRVEELLVGLEQLFTIVIVGEFNAGKSSLINALFGQKFRVEGPIPVDDKISILHYGEKPSARDISDFITEQTYPIEFLRDITLVDTPGTNSIVQRHQEITEDFIPRADLVLFVTSIDRPLSESERKFLQYVREWGKKIVFVLNKIDTKSPEEVEQVVEYLKTNVRSIFGFDPVIFPISGKLALEAKLGELSPREWTRSAFEPLEDYIFQTLSEKERIRLKLGAPLDTILSLTRKQFVMITTRREVLSSDLGKIESIREQLKRAQQDLSSNFRQFVLRIDNLMMELERRGVEFLDRYIRIGHLMLLRDAAKFREEFQRQVFHDWEGSIDRTIQESVDWLVRENMKLWSTTVEAFHRKSEIESATPDLVGKVGRDFAYNRDEVYSRIRTEAENKMSTFDLGLESRRIIDSAMQGVIQSFGLGAGALGLGYLVSTFFSSAAIDVTGLTAATMLLVTSFLILPYKRSKAKAEFGERIERLRSQLREALERECEVEIGRMISSISVAFDPYRRFYESESEKIETFASKLATVESTAREINAAVAGLAQTPPVSR
ncbi:MAG TPA: dynamin family protein [Thermoanaerobaculia bacterium]|nr:dynamin family protein [Thermoanaerobaculia bacterium]